jgi:hypothetical protein
MFGPMLSFEREYKTQPLRYCLYYLLWRFSSFVTPTHTHKAIHTVSTALHRAQYPPPTACLNFAKVDSIMPVSGPEAIACSRLMGKELDADNVLRATCALSIYLLQRVMLLCSCFCCALCMPLNVPMFVRVCATIFLCCTFSCAAPKLAVHA